MLVSTMNRDELEKNVTYLATRLRNIHKHRPQAQERVRARLLSAYERAVDALDQSGGHHA